MGCFLQWLWVKKIPASESLGTVIKNAGFWALPQTCSIRISGVRSRRLLFKQCPGWGGVTHTQFGNSLKGFIWPHHLLCILNCILIGIWRQKKGCWFPIPLGSLSSLLRWSEAACLRSHPPHFYSPWTVTGRWNHKFLSCWKSTSLNSGFFGK